MNIVFKQKLINTFLNVGGYTNIQHFSMIFMKDYNL